MTNEIQSKVNVDKIEFIKQIHTKQMQALVGYSAAQRKLTFNKKMVTLLGIENWLAVLAGRDKTSGIIVLKQCDPEEYGAVLFHKSSKDNIKLISIGHLVTSLSLQNVSCKYKAECNGRMIFLEQAK